jgi:hypothetical protein
MASVDHLLAALHDRIGEVTAHELRSPEAALLGWHRIARNASRILVMVDAPTELMPVLHAILDEAELPDSHVDTPITALGNTVGALADTLNSNPDAVAIAGLADRAQLRSCILGSLHHAAMASLAAASGDVTTPACALLRDLADTTHAASYVPWRPLHPPLNRLALGPTDASLDQAVTRWAESATDVLDSPTRVTSYAFQRTAASIARLCHSAAVAFSATGEVTPADWEAATALATAFQFWQVAAAWPSEIRLGGRTTTLRHRSQELDEALVHHARTANRTSHEEAMRSALLQAEVVAASHESSLDRLVDNRGLWVIAHALGPAYLTRHPGVHRTEWVPDPGTGYCTTLLGAAHRAGSALREAADTLDLRELVDPYTITHRLAAWETVTAFRRPPSEMAPSHSLGRRSVGR